MTTLGEADQKELPPFTSTEAADIQRLKRLLNDLVVFLLEGGLPTTNDVGTRTELARRVRAELVVRGLRKPEN